MDFVLVGQQKGLKSLQEIVEKYVRRVELSNDIVYSPLYSSAALSPHTSLALGIFSNLLAHRPDAQSEKGLRGEEENFHDRNRDDQAVVREPGE